MLLEIRCRECWLDIPGHQGYQVSSRGKVRSVDRVVVRSNGVQRRHKGQVLKQSLSTYGYPKVTLGRHTQEKVHNLVLLAFRGPCPEGMQACHFNDEKTDNCLENLRWDTPKANMIDALRNGTRARSIDGRFTSLDVS
jgi:hypothetical protein